MRYNWSARIRSYIMSEKQTEEVEVDIEDEIYDKIVAHLETEDPEVISKWVSEALSVMFKEYIDKEKDL